MAMIVPLPANRAPARPFEGSRYNRDQGYLQAPLDVSGSYSLVTAVPQNIVWGVQQIWKPSVINETKIGFKFHDWEGDVAGTARPVTLNMNTPHFVRAILEKTPALREGAVKNAAGDTPVKAVAAGSIVSIYGANLAGEFKVGPANPLTQTLSDVTVRINGRLLPLLFVLAFATSGTAVLAVARRRS
jgi:hypothetical protein